MTKPQLLIMLQECSPLISSLNEHQGLRKATAGPLCKTAQRFTAMPPATTLQTEKTPDLNIPKHYLVLIGISGQYTAKSEHQRLR